MTEGVKECLEKRNEVYDRSEMQKKVLKIERVSNFKFKMVAKSRNNFGLLNNGHKSIIHSGVVIKVMRLMLSSISLEFFPII